MTGYATYEEEGLLTGSRSRTRPFALKFRRLRFAPSTVVRLIKYFGVAALVVLTLTPIFDWFYIQRPAHYGELESGCRATEGGKSVPGCANPSSETVFIVASLHDPKGRLVDGDWGRSVLELIDLIGSENVFLSIYENDGDPEAEAALRNLKGKLRCPHALVYDPHVPLDGFPSFVMPDGSTHVKRLAYLSEMRNRALRPLDSLGPDGVKYDKILFLNDIAFHAMDAAHLLFSTNRGEDGRTQYLAACGVDYHTPFRYYDIFALRDAEGYTVGDTLFPIFTRAGEGRSRAAMLAGSDAIPVKSCWGGIVATQASYVQQLLRSSPQPEPDSSTVDIKNHIIDPDNPRNVTSPVRFRVEPDLFYEACECCLFLADIAQVSQQDGHATSSDQGIYMNSFVRVAYDQSTLSWLPWVKRWEALFIIPQAIMSTIEGMPSNNPYREVKQGQEFMEEVWIGEGMAGHWAVVPRRGRSGMFCATRNMLAMRTDDHSAGLYWEDLPIPGGQVLGLEN